MAGVYRRVRPMKAILDGQYMGEPGYLLQQKFDGSRTIAFRDGNRIILRGASWKEDYTRRFPNIVADLMKTRARKFIIDAEMTFFRGKQDVFFNVKARPETLKEQELVPRLMVFDILELNGKSVKEKPVEERLRLLKQLIPGSLKHVKVVQTFRKPKEFKKIFKKVTKQHGEGVVLKAVGSEYQEGKTKAIRSEDWIKVKKRLDADCVIVGVTEGLGWRKPWFGAVILAQYDKGKLVHVGNASGFSRPVMKGIYAKIKAMHKAPNPFGKKIDGAKKFVKPTMVCAVKYMERTKYGILRHPIFLRLRDDKTPRECTLKGDTAPSG